jgi:tetratricopeptide (TPR) repeat protein
MQKRIVAVCVAVAACTAVSAFADGDGGQAGAFLRYGVGGRALGMGRAFVAVSEDAGSVCLNPAGLMGAKRMELTSMYSDLYYDSRFAQMGVVIPRPFGSVRNGLLRFLVGPNTSLGMNWVGLSMVGFEQRSAAAELLGNFDFSEDAFLMAWAREETGNWGLFRYGFNVKALNQNYPGLSSSMSRGRDWTWGMDAGMSFQPIHARGLRIFSLRYLIPLRIGFGLQNLVQPALSVQRPESNDWFPQTLRGGVSYRWILRDWIPSSWTGLREFVGTAQILTAFDKEWIHPRSEEGRWKKWRVRGTYFGMESMIPVSQSGFCLYPRFGWNDQGENTSLGLGFLMPFASSAQIQLDYAYVNHPDLPNDSRFFMTLRLGADKGIGYFKKQADQERIRGAAERDWLLKIVAEYPSTDSQIAARSLSLLEDDSIIVRRYYDLIGGIALANSMFHDAKALLIRHKPEDAREKALDAIKEYESLFNQREENPLSDDDITNYGEALILTGRPKDALRVLEEVIHPTFRSRYLCAVAAKQEGRWDEAISQYKDVVQEIVDRAKERVAESALNPQSMACLSYLGIGESLFRKGETREALNWFTRLVEEFPDSLDTNYPRYPEYRDRNVVDDAQFLQGLCLVQMREYERGVTALLETRRFYPYFEYGETVGKQCVQLLEILEKKDWSALSQSVDAWIQEYNLRH